MDILDACDVKFLPKRTFLVKILSTLPVSITSLNQGHI